MLKITKNDPEWLQEISKASEEFDSGSMLQRRQHFLRLLWKVRKLRLILEPFAAFYKELYKDEEKDLVAMRERIFCGVGHHAITALDLWRASNMDEIESGVDDDGNFMLID
ncbi:MAG: hypothetical protein IMY86_13805 [Chloroflexi bacterium]|nr:hypothetical protein [Chloroflexota bacterium]